MPATRVTVVDCGVKRSILRELTGAGALVTVVPPDTTAEAILPAYLSQYRVRGEFEQQAV